MTVAVLRQLEGTLAQQIWVAPEQAQGDAHPCPFCSRPMQPKSVATGRASVCRACEAVWLDQAAYGALPGPAVPAPSLASQALSCPQCGAPVANSWDEHCKYCGAALHAPTQVVILPSGPAFPRLSVPGPGGLLGALLDELGDGAL